MSKNLAIAVAALQYNGGLACLKSMAATMNLVDSNVRGLPSFFCVRFDFLHSSTLKGRKARETLELEKS